MQKLGYFILGFLAISLALQIYVFFQVRSLKNKSILTSSQAMQYQIILAVSLASLVVAVILTLVTLFYKPIILQPIIEAPEIKKASLPSYHPRPYKHAY